MSEKENETILTGNVIEPESESESPAPVEPEGNISMSPGPMPLPTLGVINSVRSS